MYYTGLYHPGKKKWKQLGLYTAKVLTKIEISVQLRKRLKRSGHKLALPSI